MSEQEQGFTFTLVPFGETVALNTFVRATSDVRKLVADLDYAVTRDRHAPHWIVTHLQSSVPKVTIAPIIGGQRTLEILKSGVNEVTTGQETSPPDYFTDDVLKDMQRMNALFTGPYRLGRMIFEIRREPFATVERNIKAKVERYYNRSYKALGALEGNLEKVDIHGPATFTIWDRATNVPVRCYFNRDNLPFVRDLLGKRVRVGGLVSYFNNGVPYLVSNIQMLNEIEELDTSNERDYASIPDLTNGIDSVEYVRSRRKYY